MLVDFLTANGSVYEVDFDRKLARRVFGQGNPTARTKEFRKFDVLMMTAEQRLLFIWDSSTSLLTGSPDNAIPATLTSRVLEIID